MPRALSGTTRSPGNDTEPPSGPSASIRNSRRSATRDMLPEFGRRYPARVRLFDHSSGGLREVEMHPRICVYVCGITPYDSAHLGHPVTYTHFDALVRYLPHQGSDVGPVQHVTEVV